MRKKASYILLICLLVFSHSYTSAFTFQVGDEDIYYGISSYENIIRNISYRDIGKSFAREPIIRLTVFHVFRGEGANFKPKGRIRVKESLKYIARALGVEEGDYLKELQNLNILTSGEYKAITETSKGNQYTTREELALWLSRSLKLKGRNPYLITGFKDYSRFNVNNIRLIEDFLQRGYMVGYKDGYFRPKQGISKEELAMVLARALDDLWYLKGGKIKEGEVDYIKIVSTTELGSPTIKRVYYMKNKDRTYPTIYTYESRMNHLNKGFIIYNKGRLQTQNILKRGHTVKYYIDSENNLVYGELKGIY